MREWVTVLRAADAAARWHVHQRRKSSAQEPYINHLLEVASLVAEATHGKDPDLVIAALLHDAIEDQEVPYELITREFGKRVADVVVKDTNAGAPASQAVLGPKPHPCRFPHAKTIVLVQDNLNIHSKASLYEAFPVAEARRLVERFEWHYTPKHGSWLDLAESELGVLSAQCLDRRIPDKQTLIEEIAAWEHDRNANHTKAAGNSQPNPLVSNLNTYTLRSS